MIWLNLISTHEISLKGIKNHLLIFLKGEFELKKKKKNVPIEMKSGHAILVTNLGTWACHTLSLDSAILIIKNNKK